MLLGFGNGFVYRAPSHAIGKIVDPRSIEVDEATEQAKITMILTTPFCPYGPQLIEQVRMVGNQMMPGGVQVEIGNELWDPSMMEEGAGGDWGLF